jgi:hypothetical protein
VWLLPLLPAAHDNNAAATIPTTKVDDDDDDVRIFIVLVSPLLLFALRCRLQTGFGSASMVVMDVVDCGCGRLASEKRGPSTFKMRVLLRVCPYVFCLLVCKKKEEKVSNRQLHKKRVLLHLLHHSSTTSTSRISGDDNNNQQQ